MSDDYEPKFGHLTMKIKTTNGTLQFDLNLIPIALVIATVVGLWWYFG